MGDSVRPKWAEKWRAAVHASFRGGAGSHLTLSPWPRPTCVPSGILIHPTVWLQYTNVTRHIDRQRSESIGRTVLQTVAQSPKYCDRHFAAFRIHSRRPCRHVNYSSSSFYRPSIRQYGMHNVRGKRYTSLMASSVLSGV